MRSGTLLLTVLCLCLALAGCGDPTADLAGTWTQVEGAKPQTRLILRADGSGKLEVPGDVNHQLDSWSIASEGHLTFRVFSQDVLVRFILNDDSLEISRAEAFEQMNGTYRRTGD